MMTESAPASIASSPESIHRESPALSFYRVSKVFADGTEAFRDVSFHLHAGELASIVGPSGCGKSTILRIASGLLSPSGGSVKRAEGSLGFVFQDPTLLPWRTVQRNAELFLELDGQPKPNRRRLAEEALALVGLTEFAQHLPRQLSGGMRMRVSVARSLATSPTLFLFDEPFGALDEITRQHLDEELSGLFVERGFAGLFVTHSIFEAVFLSTRVFVMSSRPGRTVAEFNVPFDLPRKSELRFDPAFGAVANKVSDALQASLS